MPIVKTADRSPSSAWTRGGAWSPPRWASTSAAGTLERELR